MANTYVDYTAVASQTDYNFSFEYLRDDHVKVKVNDVIVTNYTIVTSPVQLIRFDTAPTGGAEIRIYRDSRGDFSPLVDFEDGSVLTQVPLDEAYRHNLFVAQEASEGTGNELLNKKGGANYDAEDNKIINLGSPTTATDAATKSYVDQTIDNAELVGGSPATVSLGVYDVTSTNDTLKQLRAWTADIETGDKSNTTVTATGSTTARTLADRFGQVYNVDDFGAAGNGTTDDKTAIRLALDAAAGNGVVEFTAGKTYYTSETIMIPRSNLGQSMIIRGNGAKIVGTLSTNIFETAQEQYSTGATSNFDQGNEVYIHSNLHILDLVFETYDVAIKAYNANFNSEIKGCTFRVGKTALELKRCFYLTVTQNTIRTGYSAKPDDEVSVKLSTFSNVLYFNDNHISNWDGSAARGVGIKLEAGANAFALSECAIEGCKIGLHLTGENQPFDILDNYFEANEKSIYHESGAFRGTIRGNWFYDPITFDSDASPIVKFFGNYNVNNGDIIADGSTSLFQLDSGPILQTESSITNKLARPSEQQLGSAAIFMGDGFQVVYDSAQGYAGAGGRSTISYQDMLMPFNYFGRPFRINTGVPFVDITHSGTNLVLDTRIQYIANYNGGIEYDLTIFHHQTNGTPITAYISGRTLPDDTVVKYDSGTEPVTVSNNVGYVKITVGNINSYGGSDPAATTYGRIRAV